MSIIINYYYNFNAGRVSVLVTLLSIDLLMIYTKYRSILMMNMF